MDWSPGYREFAPPAGLRDTLSCLWVGITPPGPAQTTLVLPDGAVDLVWQQGARSFLAGPDTGPVPSSAPGGMVTVGARFRPGAGGTVLGLPLSEVLDQQVETADIPALRGRTPSADPAALLCPGRAHRPHRRPGPAAPGRPGHDLRRTFARPPRQPRRGRGRRARAQRAPVPPPLPGQRRLRAANPPARAALPAVRVGRRRRPAARRPGRRRPGRRVRRPVPPDQGVRPAVRPDPAGAGAGQGQRRSAPAPAPVRASRPPSAGSA